MYIVLDPRRRIVFRGLLSEATSFLLHAYPSLDLAVRSGMRIELERGGSR